MNSGLKKKEKKMSQVKGDQIKVNYVDYGNVETVSPENLRKQIKLREIPVQCYKLPLRSDCVPVSYTRVYDFRRLERQSHLIDTYIFFVSDRKSASGPHFKLS